MTPKQMKELANLMSINIKKSEENATRVLELHKKREIAYKDEKRTENIAIMKCLAFKRQ